MTTVIGIKGKNPSTDESYVLILTDSRGSLPSGNSFSDNGKKLFSPEGSNYAFGTAGKCIDGLFSSSSSSRGKEITSKGGEFFKDSMQNALLGMNNELHQDFGITNDYLVGLQTNNDVDMYVQKEDILIPSLTFTMVGSGAGHIGDSLSLYLKYKNGEIYQNPDEVIKLAVDAMKNAANGDHGTGGRVNIAIMTKDSVEIKRDYANLNDLVKEERSFNDLGPLRGMHPMYRDDD